MNREMKFRAWHQNLMKPGSNEHMIYSHKERSLSDFFSQLGNCAGHWHNYIMQYTGFNLDGKEVYEGDILREETDDEIYFAVVTWIKEWCMFACLVINADMNEYETYLTLGADGLDESMFWTFPLQAEEFGKRYLQGNIYQNPNLLNLPTTHNSTQHP